MCAVVWLSNFRLKQLSNRVSRAVTTIYEDRLLAQDLIFSFILLINRLRSPIPPQNLDEITLKSKKLRTEYLRTTLTREEAEIFRQFYQQFLVLSSANNSCDENCLTKMNSQLKRLEAIQVEEAEKQMKIIEQAKGSQTVNFYLETAAILFLLLLAQNLLTSNSHIRRALKKNAEECRLN